MNFDRPKNSKGMVVFVKDDNVEKALRKFKKKIQESGLLLELRDRAEYTKPNVIRKQKKKQAVRRWKKQLSSQQLPKQLY